MNWATFGWLQHRFRLEKWRLKKTFSTLPAILFLNRAVYKVIYTVMTSLAPFLLPPPTTNCFLHCTLPQLLLWIWAYSFPIFIHISLESCCIHTLHVALNVKNFKLWYDSQSASVMIWHSLGSVQGSENTSKIILDIILEQKQNLQLMSARLPRLKERIQMGFLSFWHFDICKFEVGIFYLMANGSFSIAVQSNWTSR